MERWVLVVVVVVVVVASEDRGRILLLLRTFLRSFHSKDTEKLGSGWRQWIRRKKEQSRVEQKKETKRKKKKEAPLPLPLPLAPWRQASRLNPS